MEPLKGKSHLHIYMPENLKNGVSTCGNMLDKVAFIMTLMFVKVQQIHTESLKLVLQALNTSSREISRGLCGHLLYISSPRSSPKRERNPLELS